MEQRFGVCEQYFVSFPIYQEAVYFNKKCCSDFKVCNSNGRISGENISGWEGIPRPPKIASHGSPVLSLSLPSMPLS